MANFEFEIVRHIGVIKTNKSGWVKELNIVSWDGKDAKYDIREWNEDHTRMSRGITFTENELEILFEFLKSEFEN